MEDSIPAWAHSDASISDELTLGYMKIYYNFPEAYVEVSRAGNPTKPKVLKKVDLELKHIDLKPELIPTFEVLTTQPRAGEPLRIRYRKYEESEVQNWRILVKCGVNRW